MKMWDILHNNESWTGPVTLFYHDMLALIQSLMGNLIFKDHMSFAMEQYFIKERACQYGEIHWSIFWWETQVSLNFIANFLTQRTEIFL